jgi:peptidoglycan/LPS O-acetylase OafA/YrhL
MKGRLVGLDALRGIAALVVVFDHFPALDDVRVIERGYLAVDFFFLLSGFVMARTYDGRLGLSFLKARWWRLWPMMAAGTVLGAVAFGATAEQLTFALLLLPWFGGLMVSPLNVPAWSITFELLANAFHSLGKVSMVVLWAIILAAWIATAAAAVSAENLNVGSQAVAWWCGIPRVIFSYFLGVALFRLWGDDQPLRIPAVFAAVALPVVAYLPGDWMIDLAFITLVSPLMLMGGVRWTPRWGSMAGNMSFPLYALHYPILAMAPNLWVGALIAVLLALAIGNFGIVESKAIAINRIRQSVQRYFHSRKHLNPPT